MRFLTTKAVFVCPHGIPVTIEPMGTAPDILLFRAGQQTAPFHTDRSLKNAVFNCGASGPGIIPCTQVTHVLTGAFGDSNIAGARLLTTDLSALTNGSPPAFLRVRRPGQFIALLASSARVSPHARRANKRAQDPHSAFWAKFLIKIDGRKPRAEA